MTLVSLEKTALPADLKEKAQARNWIAVNPRTGIHLAKAGSRTYLLKVPKDLSENYLDHSEALFAERECNEYVILGASDKKEAIEIAHFLLQASVEIAPTEDHQPASKQEPVAAALAL
jgi:hypothetical protein